MFKLQFHTEAGSKKNDVINEKYPEKQNLNFTADYHLALEFTS